MDLVRLGLLQSNKNYATLTLLEQADVLSMPAL